MLRKSRTQINQQRIGKGMSQLLRDGNEISFGSWQPQHGPAAVEDYRMFLLQSSPSLN